MTDTSTTERTSPETIEREVERTQDQIGQTVDKIEDKLNPREMARSLMGDENADVAKEAVEIARTNPIPVAMIAIGAIWLVATSPAPAMRRIRERLRGNMRSDRRMNLRPRSEEPAPIGPSPTGESYDRRPATATA